MNINTYIVGEIHVEKTTMTLKHSLALKASDVLYGN